MTHVEARAHVEAVLGMVPFATPVDVAYCVAVRDELRKRVPEAKIEAYHRYREIVVGVRQGGLEFELVVKLG